MEKKEINYIAVSEKETIVLPLPEMAEKFACTTEEIILNSVRGSQKEALGQKWTFDLAFER